ncbi:MAG: deoxyribodipyrimidine photolyase [Bdellovibrio sp. 28-41-41]|nr:MAG: deoxyribodipyrimidine photolyase [Bdellovibrio sp. 28-41-41]
MLKFTVFWFRRDLRLNDNAGLFHALKDGKNVLPIFIFDTEILKAIKNPNDRRVVFIHRELDLIKTQLNKLGSDLLVFAGEPVSVFQKLVKTYSLEKVYTNRDYEPYARERDKKVSDILAEHGVELLTFKDQVIFEKNDILTDQKKTYSVYTPYKKKWLTTIQESDYAARKTEGYFENFHSSKMKSKMPTLAELGFNDIEFEFPSLTWPADQMKKYKEQRDIPSIESGTSRFGLHLRFGTVSVRELVKKAIKNSDVWLSELIWREFFMQILWHYPKTQTLSFRPQYENIKWRNDEKEFAAWSTGQTGYPLVDAGIRELLQTGHMHNRVRMVVASFLSKHLLTHWYLGERFFAQHLLDYDLSANNGNWQWAAGTGCDAAPYFRVFNPTTQIEKFDPDYIYIKKWVPEFGTAKYPKPIVEHVFARTRALEEYKKGLNK